MHIEHLTTSTTLCVCGVFRSFTSKGFSGRQVRASLVLPTLILCWIPALQAQFSYSTNDDGTLLITGYTGSGGTATIPDTINGLPVRGIAPSAFSFSQITDVSFPDSLRELGDWAFLGCEGLTRLTLPDSVLRIGDGVFARCTGLTRVEIGNGLTNIAGSAFWGCLSLTNVTLGNGVTRIGNYAFEECTSLQDLAIPDGVTSIGYLAFHLCSNLRSVLMGNGLITIDNTAFTDCRSLTNFTVDPLNPVYSSVDGVLLNRSQETLIAMPLGKGGDYVVPGTVTNIGEEAISGCGALTSVTMPEGLVGIGAYAFYDCTGLNRVTIPNSVISVEGGAFLSCTGLTSLTIGSNVTSIGAWAFAGCTGLTSVTIPASVTNLALNLYLHQVGFSGSFVGCANLTNFTVDPFNPVYSSVGGVILSKTQEVLISCPPGKEGLYLVPRSVTTIVGDAFGDCGRLTSICIPGSVTNIWWNSFRGSVGLTNISVDAHNPSFSSRGGVLFNKAGDMVVYYPEGRVGPTILPRANLANGYGFDVAGTPDTPIVVLATENLTLGPWSPTSTNWLSGGLASFVDSQWTNHPIRFYRIRSP